MSVTVGSQVQEARKARKLSLGDVTAATKIQPWVLEALESDKLQELMSPIYVKGFLSSYAKFLRLDPESLVAQLTWPAPEPAQAELPPATPAVPMSLRLPWPLLKRLGVATALAGVIAGFVILRPAQRMAKTAQPDRSSATLVKASPRRSTPERTKPAAPKAAPQKPEVPRLASVTPVREPLALPTPPMPAPVAVAPLELSLTASRTTWIQVKADGKLLTQQRVSRGAAERWTAKKQFEVIVSKPSQVELALNGQPINSAAIANKGRLLITHRGIAPLPAPRE